MCLVRTMNLLVLLNHFKTVEYSIVQEIETIREDTIKIQEKSVINIAFEKEAMISAIKTLLEETVIKQKETIDEKSEEFLALSSSLVFQSRQSTWVLETLRKS